MKPIRILQIVPNMQAGGLEASIMNIYRNIDRNKIQFDFLVHYMDEKFYDKEIKALGGNIYRFSLRDDNNIFRYIKKLNCFYKNHPEFKVIHCHMSSIGFLNFLVAKKNKINVRIAHSHNTNVEKTIKGFFKRVLMLPYKYISTIQYACTKDAGNFLFHNKEFTVIPNAFMVEKYKFNSAKRTEIRDELALKDKMVLGNVGRFSRQKNQLFLLDIFAEFLKLQSDSVLMLIGSGELDRQIREKAHKLKIDDKILFLGNKKNVEDYYQAMDVFVFPSLFEGLGIVLLEAQVSGLPVYINDCLPEDVQLTNLVKVLNHKESAPKWAKTIAETVFTSRKSHVDEIAQAGYSIEKLCKRLEDEYTALYQQK